MELFDVLGFETVQDIILGESAGLLDELWGLSVEVGVSVDDELCEGVGTLDFLIICGISWFFKSPFWMKASSC